MADCKSYYNLISELQDSELEAAKESELRAHIDSCPECRRIYEAFSGISEALEEELVPVPEALASGIMFKINMENEIKEKQKKRRRWSSYLTAAACFAMVVFGVAQSGLFGGSKQETASVPMADYYKAAAEMDTEFPAPEAPMLDITSNGLGSETESGLFVAGAPGENIDDAPLSFELQTELLNYAFASNARFMEFETERLSSAKSISIHFGGTPNAAANTKSETPRSVLDEASRAKLIKLMTADAILAYDDSVIGTVETYCTILFSGIPAHDGGAEGEVRVTVWISDDLLYFKLDSQPPIFYRSDTFPIDFVEFVESLTIMTE